MEILPGIHRIANAVSTAYLLIDEREGLTIIDAGPAGFDRTIARYLQRIGQRPDDVRRILLTHRHFDHIGGAAGLRGATHARVWAHALDAPQIDGTEPYRYPRGAMGLAMRSTIPLFSRLRPCPVDGRLVPGETFNLGSLGELQILFTPGHTLGHCSMLLPAQRLAIMGDALMHVGGRLRVAPAFLNDDDALARTSARQLADLDVDALVFGHGPPILKDGREALRAMAV